MQQTSKTHLQAMQQTSTTRLEAMQQTSTTCLQAMQQTSTTRLQAMQQTNTTRGEAVTQTSPTCLVIVEHDVGINVLAGHGVSPEFLHEEDLVGESGRAARVGRASLHDPVGEVAHKVKEEVALRYADHCRTIATKS